jgi:hypothetical protein
MQYASDSACVNSNNALLIKLFFKVNITYVLQKNTQYCNIHNKISFHLSNRCTIDH